VPTIDQWIDVKVPIRTAYNQWTQFEEFPRFMDGVELVAQLRDDRLRWRWTIAGKTVAWDATIDVQDPDERIAWHATSGMPHHGTVTFTPLGELETRVTLHIEYEPEGLAESLADAFGLVTRRVQSDLRRFKEFIETRGCETGAWRGAIRDGRVRVHA
jgi:uncharacterized membrane protein